MVRTRVSPRRNLSSTTVQVVAATAARLEKSNGGVGVKKIENIRRRNKNIKTKKLLPQTKNTEVEHRGRLVKRMTVRRRAIFSSTRRQREY